MENLPRDFKGIWIPREIWLDQTLTYFEKCLLAEINSLNGSDGCYASNEYLCKFFNERERKIQDGLAKLKAKGYIYTESFDGRTRIMRTNLSPQNDKSLFSTSDLSKIDTPDLSKIDTPSSVPYTIYRKKEESKPTTTGAAVGEKKVFPSETVHYKTPGGKEKYISESDIYSHFLKSNFKTETVAEAIQIVKSKQEPIGNIIKLIESVCFSIENNPHAKIKSSKENPKASWESVPKKTDKAYKMTEEDIKKFGIKPKDKING